jgi:hypothetical protein
MPLPGARESGAGDQFHFLFAARRAVDLLDPSSKLERVRLEGFSPSEPASASADLLLGADLTEYYGGGSFSSAEKVVVSQLKYSHRRPDRAWTAARMTTATSASGHSVISRLAELYVAVKGNHSRAEAIRKLRLRLVSNQPAAPSLVAALDGAQNLIRLSKHSLATDELLNLLPQDASKKIGRLREHAGLAGDEFLDFLRLLDLSECGAESRAIQEVELSRELRKYLPADFQAATDRIYRKIEAEALPETEQSPGITRADVLLLFEIDSVGTLFPIPAHFEQVADPIPTPDVANLASALVGASGGRLIAHGDAGVGKTTTLLQLEEALPRGSIAIVYDCFGGGSYLDPAEGRHLVTRAVYQLVNELAVRCDTPVLLRPPLVEAELWRLFRERIAEAASALKGGGQVLVITIDAADNAFFAARQAGERCFVPSLWHLTIPSNVRILVSARTHRVDELDAPAEVPQCELRGFGSDESAAYLRRRFVGADDAAAAAFHSNSSGNPRVQFYVLDPERAPDLSVEAAVSDARRTPDDIFNDLVDSAVHQARQPELTEEMLANLVCLARPARISTLAAATRVAPEIAGGFCHGLAPGVVIEPESGTVAFRDEDFEKHLRKLVSDEGEAGSHRRLASYFLTRDETDPEAATVVAEHLFRAEQLEELVGFTLQRGEPMAIADPVVRLQAYQRRLTFALRAALALGTTADALRLIVLAGEAARSGSAVENVVRERPELAMRHGDTRGVAAIYLRQDNAAWRGPLHLRVAAMYAREGDRVEATEHFHLAEAWLREALRRTRSEPEEDDLDEDAWQITIDDLAAGAEALYWLRGLKTAITWLKRWRPPEAVFAATTKLAFAIGGKDDPRRLLEQLKTTRLHARAEAAFLTAVSSSGASVPSKRLKQLVPLVTRAVRRSPIRFRQTRLDGLESEEDWALRFAELAAAKRVGHEEVLALAQRAGPALPRFAPADWDDLRGYDLTLRRVTLEAALTDTDLKPEDLIPIDLARDKTDDQREVTRKETERTRYVNAFSQLLPAYKIRARVLSRRTALRDIEVAIRQQLASRRDASEHRWASFDRRYATWARVVTDAALQAVDGNAEPLVTAIAEVGRAAVRGAAPDLWLDLAELALRHESYRSLAATLADQAASYVEENDLPASERTNTLLRAAALLDPYEDSLAHDYYERAVVAAAGIDDDSVTLLELHAGMARRLPQSDPQAAELTHRLIGLVESFRAKVSDEDRLPYRQTLSAAASLHPPTAFAATSRWDDENRFRIEDAIEPLATAAVECDYLTPRSGTWLLRLQGERSDPTVVALQYLDRLVPAGRARSAALEELTGDLARWVATDVPASSRVDAAKRLVEWADQSGRPTLQGIGELRELVDYAETFQADSDNAESRLRRRSKRRPQEVSVPADPSDLIARLDELSGRFPSDSEIEAMIAETANATPPPRRVVFLEMVVGLPSDNWAVRWHPEAVVRALAQVLYSWRHSGPVKRWAQSGIPLFVEQHFVALVAYAEPAARTLRALFRLPFVEEPAALLLRGISSHLDNLSAAQLFAIAESVASVLDESALSEVLSWSMGRLEHTNAPFEPARLPVNADTTLAAFLFALFGNVDKRVRWRAAHVARALARPDQQGFVDALVAHSGAETGGAFVSARYPFYWLSARQWLIAVLVRLSDEHPAALRGHIETLSTSALNVELPHAAIRDMAKRAVLSAMRYRGDAAGDERFTELQLANAPQSCLPERSYRQGHGDSRRERDDRRFRFDSMDTLPYWYEPLGRMFNLSAHAIADRAEQWIVDRFGYADSDVWTDQRELSRRNDYDETRNDHGSVPVLETLRTYLEYHAMLLVAGELCDEGVPVAYDEWDEAPGPWEEWLSRHVEAFPHWWISDLRVPPPLVPFAYAPLSAVKDWSEITDEDFEAQLFVERDGEPWMVVHSHLRMQASDRHSSVQTRAAVVAPETALSLLRAYQSAANPHDYYLPAEEADEWIPGRAEIDDGDFTLEGVLVHIRRERESLEEHDPLRRITYSFERPGDTFATALQATTDETELVLIDRNDRYVSETQLWSDEIGDERDYVSHPYTTGERTVVPVSALLDFLRQRNLDMIAEVQISRRENRTNYARGDYEPPKHKIYLLRRNGTVETVAGRSQVGRQDRP